jgi:hypothetical protein
MAVAVNGQAVAATPSDGFISVSRVWQPNDKVELAFPLFVQVSRLQDNQNAVAFTYGPVVLSAGLGTASMTTEAHGVQVLAATKPTGLQDTIKLNGGTINDFLANIQSNLVQTPGKLEFALKNTDSDDKLVFIPHYSRYKDRYGIYWLLSGTAGATTPTNLVCPNVTVGGTGGTGGTGGMSAGGGSGTETGGGTASGGSSTGGSATVSDGGAGSGATMSTGGSAPSSGGSSSGNAGHPATGGAVATAGGTGGTNGSAPANSTGCSCKVANRSATEPWILSLLLGLGLGARRQRRRGQPRAA